MISASWVTSLVLKFLCYPLRIPVGFLWNFRGISVESLKDFCGISVEFLWSFCGILSHFCGIPVGFLWNDFCSGASQVPGHNTCLTWEPSIRHPHVLQFFAHVSHACAFRQRCGGRRCPLCCYRGGSPFAMGRRIKLGIRTVAHWDAE